MNGDDAVLAGSGIHDQMQDLLKVGYSVLIE